MTSTPVVLFAFARPEVTLRTFEAIRAARPETLLLVVDGPRDGRPDDATKVAEVRTILEGVDWPATVHTRFSETNLGLEASVELGLDWAFTLVDEAIVFEDDCVADPTFFTYAEELLERYRGDHRVWQVAGGSHGVEPSLFGDDSYAFASWASVWGWATWADRWQAHRRLFTRQHQPPHSAEGIAPVRTMPVVIPPGALVTKGCQRHFAEAATSDDVITHGWDKHWWLTIMAAGGLCATPRTNLVENVGFGEDATHAVAHGRADHAVVPMGFPLQHPARVALHVEVERELELLLNRQGGRAAQLARKLVRSPRLRAAIRRVVHSRTAVRISRAVSRLRHTGGPAQLPPPQE